eukprot:GFUD01026239.1.p1 GENE.GFUD01026239.1~~GFUD01026239.1.p1  ORF type:complete len:658 (+),score=221.85 GFUD01026239.1:86-2059(+)
MELGIIVERLQNKLVLNDQKLEDIDCKRKELTKSSQEVQEKISALCGEVQARVGAAGEALKGKTVVEFTKLEKELSSTREEVRSDSLVLCSELEKITESVGRGDEEKFDLDECWGRVKEIISRCQLDESTRKMPSFYHSKTLAKVKTSDLGYLSVAEFLPDQFQLVLTSPVSSLMVASDMNKVICSVTTSQQFTEMIQANIKFSIKNKACKETVPYCKEECKLSEDKKSFQICFLVHQPGVYMLTVLLYDQHVNDSPLVLRVASKDEMVKEEENTTPEDQEQSTSLSVNPGVARQQEPEQDCLVLVSPTITKTTTTSPTTQSMSSQPPPSAVPLRRPVPLTRAVSSPSKPPPTNPISIPPPATLLPPGPLNLSHLSPGGKLSGLRMLSIEEGTKPDSLHKPIGMCLLQNGNIVVASTFEDKVKMFSPTGKFLTLVSSSESRFMRPSDMVTLQSGQFVVRDNNRVQVFSHTGTYLRTLWQDNGHDKCYGLAQDKEGRLVTIMDTRRQKKTDLLFFDLDTGKLARKIEMDDIITDKSRSKCRFLTYELGKLYITDLGLDCVYVLDPTTISVKVFGSTGSGPGQVSDPAGLVVDTVGNIIVADSRNHRLCLFSMEGKFVCNLSLSPEARRPSGVVLDKENRELYVLTLQGRAAMTKYKLK